MTNWYLVFNHVSYFEAVGRPSLLKHLWSLAIEEQFYVVWPLLLTAGMMLLRTRRMLYAVLVGAVASTVLMAALYTPNADPSRVYYGTDTRAASLLIGAALAFLWMPGQSPRRMRPALPLLLDAMGLAALGALVFFCLRIGEYQPFLYRGGFALVSLTTAVLILALVHPRAHLGAKLLGRQPLRWIGLRSYGIYLWHWPIFMITRPQLDVPIDGLPLLALRLAATVGIAALSYRYVETPIRKGALGRSWRSLREARGSRRWRLGLRWAGVLGPGLVLCAVLGIAVAQARPPQPPSYLAKMKVHVENPVRKSEPGKRISKTSPGAKAPATTPESAAGRGKATPTTGSSGVTSAGTVTAVGDSVMIGAVPQLERDIPNLTLIDARGSREAPAAIDVLRKWRAEGKLGDVVIVHIGSNGDFTPEEFDEMMRVLAGVRKVLVVNTTVPDGYQWAPNNAVLANGVKRYPKKAVLVDWHAASAGHPEYFWDGLHLTPQGAQAYASLIAAAYKKQLRSP